MTYDPIHPAQEPEQLRQAARCGAKTRSETPCRSPAVTGRRRFRMHGGAPGSSGPKGSHNGNYKHGQYTAEAIASRRWLRQYISDARALVSQGQNMVDGIRQIGVSEVTYYLAPGVWWAEDRAGETPEGP